MGRDLRRSRRGTVRHHRQPGVDQRRARSQVRAFRAVHGEPWRRDRRQGHPDIDSLASLSGKTTAQSLSSNWYDLAKENGAKVESVEGWAQAIALLEQGRVDATLNDKLTFLDYKATDAAGASGLKIAAETDDPSRNAFVVKKGESALISAVDDALDELRADGTLTEISKKYFGEDVTE